MRVLTAGADARAEALSYLRAGGWTNYQEIVIYGSDPTLWDTDSDNVKDSLDAFPRDPAETLDTDHDGIGDNADADDDGDGLSDADEASTRCEAIMRCHCRC